MALVREKYLELLYEVEQVCNAASRNLSDVKILAATKYADFGLINEAIRVGVNLIGENKIQNAVEKFGQILPVEKHFIGHLQSNKVKVAVKLFDMIESVDSLALAEKINLEAEKLQKVMPVLLEVNVADDKNKFGLKSDLVKEVLMRCLELRFLKVEGLMTIVPFAEDVETVRPFFKQMKALFDECSVLAPGMKILSMGMSHDFKVAIQEGSTQIRIGSRIFI